MLYLPPGAAVEGTDSDSSDSPIGHHHAFNLRRFVINYVAICFTNIVPRATIAGIPNRSRFSLETKKGWINGSRNL
jgi:hypothetical protein